jgi:tetratricopeptide (TPR) repeat protein
MPEVVDTLLEEAIEALRNDQRARAREVLTRLLKANQQSVTYWIWMSTAVDTLKERVYCLRTVLKLDPANETARRGLIMMGALPLDTNVKPFPVGKSRPWEDKLHLEFETPRPRGLTGFVENPGARMAGILVIGVLLIASILVIGLSSRTAGVLPGRGFTAPGGPTATFTPTPTFINVTGRQGATPGVTTPLAVLLGISYTPTPVYVNTPRAPQAADEYRAAQASYSRGEWDDYVKRMMDVQKLEPKSADVQYEIAERYRLSGDCSKALFYYNETLKIDDGFAPGYLGLVRARRCTEPGADVLPLLDLARRSDAGYGEVYLERADFYLQQKDFSRALPDLQQAQKLLPNSVLVQLGFARAYLLQNSPTRALNAAERAYKIDKTALPVYYYLGRAYMDTGAYEKAVEPLNVYLLYETEDAGAYAMLGEALARTEKYREAVEALNQALRLDHAQISAYLYLGTSYLRLNNLAGAEINLRRAIEFFPQSFEANIGLTEIFYKKGTYGTSYLQAETAFSKARTDQEKALAVYWRALSHEGRKSWGDAIQDWKLLLAFPPGAITSEMRTEARDHLRSIATPTRTPVGPRVTATPTVSPTRRPGSTATPASGARGPTPARTPTPSKTP